MSKDYDVAITSRAEYETTETVKGPDGDVVVPLKKFAIKVRLNGVLTKCFTKRNPKHHKGASITVFDKGEDVPWEEGTKFESQFIVVDGYNDVDTYKDVAEYEGARDALLASV
jgi:hypothetical protein